MRIIRNLKRGGPGPGRGEGRRGTRAWEGRRGDGGNLKVEEGSGKR